MSLTIVRMNTASSQTNTVLLLTLPPLSDDLLDYRFDVEYQNALPLYLHRASDAWLGRFRSVRCRELIDWHVLNVPHIVDPDPDPSLDVVHQQNQSLLADVGGPAKNDSAVDDRNDRSAQIDQAANGGRRTGQPRHWLGRDDLTE
jgi:hypothetical protein